MKSLKAKAEDAVLGRVCDSGGSEVLRGQTDRGARCLGLGKHLGTNCSPAAVFASGVQVLCSLQ